MKKRKKYFNRLIYGSWSTTLLLFIFGILLFIKPELANALVGYVVGTIVLLTGIIAIINYLKAKKEFKYMRLELIYGIITLTAGVFTILNPLSISSFITIGLGIWMIINGLLKLNMAMFLKRKREEISNILFVISILVLMCATILIFNPFKTTMLVTQVLGLFLIVYSILDTMQTLLMKKRSKIIIEFIK